MGCESIESRRPIPGSMPARLRHVPAPITSFRLAEWLRFRTMTTHKSRSTGRITSIRDLAGSCGARILRHEGTKPEKMTRFDGDKSPAFEIVEPAEWRAPVIFNSPHSGSTYPDDFLSASRIDLPQLRRSEDSFMDELIGHLSARGFPTVRVNFPRSYVDVNREPYELD